ncbi:PKD domain-containing protein [archaeon]|jgi:PKD repeat protein|nr:PKD domain-containing protein [archaeon]
MNFKYFTVLCFVLISLTFVAADFSLGNESYIIETEYGQNSFLEGWLNISLENQASNSFFTDSEDNSILLREILDLDVNSNYNYNCSILNCSSNYESDYSFLSENFNLEAGESFLAGLEFNGDIESIKSIQFVIDSDAQSSCANQLKIDILNNNETNFGNDVSSEEICLGKNQGCFNETSSSEEVLMGGIPFCQKIEFNEAPGFKLGAWIWEKVPGNRQLEMKVYDLNGTEINSCNLAKADLIDGGGDISCEIDYLVTEPTENYVCAFAKGTTGEYKAKGYSLEEGCGFRGFPSKPETAAYYIFIESKKFGEVGSLLVKDTFPDNTSFAELAENYILSTYGDLNCEKSCFVPIKISTFQNQRIELRNLNIIYDKKNLPGIEGNTFHLLNEIPSEIDSEIQILSLGEKFRLPNETEEISYILFLEDQEIFEETINITNITIKISPTKVAEGFPTLFTAEFNSNVSAKRYEWDFGNGNQSLSSSNQINYIYASNGTYELKVSITDLNNRKFFETATIIVDSPEETINNTILKLEGNLDNLKKQRIKLDSFIKSLVDEVVNIDLIENELKEIKNEFKYANSDNDYKILIDKLIEIEIPSSIITASTSSVTFYPNKDLINLEFLEEILGEKYNQTLEEEYLDAIFSWNQNNLETRISMEEVFFKWDSFTQSQFRVFELKFDEKEILEYDSYFILRDLLGLVTDADLIDREGYSYIELTGLDKISIATTQNLNFASLPVYISPAFSDLEISEVIVGPEGWNLWWILIIILIVLILVGFIVYNKMQEWYDKKYEKKLFPNRNDLYNLITFINNSKAKKIEESKIKQSLRKAKWSSEQVRYVSRKYLGQNTGLKKLRFKVGFGKSKKPKMFRPKKPMQKINK